MPVLHQSRLLFFFFFFFLSTRMISCAEGSNFFSENVFLLMIERAFRSVGAARKSPSLHRRRRRASLRTNIFPPFRSRRKFHLKQESDDHLSLYFPSRTFPIFRLLQKVGRGQRRYTTITSAHGIPPPSLERNELIYHFPLVSFGNSRFVQLQSTSIYIYSCMW